MKRSDPPREPLSGRSALVAVPILLFAIDALSRVGRGEATEFLLVPPLAVVAYLLFSNPERCDARLRAVVLLPLVGALIGEGGYLLLGLTPWGIAAVLLLVLLAQRALRATMPPALAIAVLAMFLRVGGPWYPLDVALGTAFVWVAFHGWRALAELAARRPGHGPRWPGG
jgi:CBS-domain-containing membrane protein